MADVVAVVGTSVGVAVVGTAVAVGMAVGVAMVGAAVSITVGKAVVGVAIGTDDGVANVVGTSVGVASGRTRRSRNVRGTTIIDTCAGAVRPA